MDEGFTVDANLQAAGGDVNKAYRTAQDQVRQSGANPKDVKIQFDATTESRIVKTTTVKEMRQSRINSLLEHATHYTVKDFMSKIK